MYLIEFIKLLNDSQMTLISPLLNSSHVNTLLNAQKDLYYTGMLLEVLRNLTKSQISNITENSTIVSFFDLFVRDYIVNDPKINRLIGFITPKQISEMSKTQIITNIINLSLVNFLSDESKIALYNIIKLNNSNCTNNDECISGYCGSSDNKNICMPANNCSESNICPVNNTCINNMCIDEKIGPYWRNH
jgi:hypothetical protein